MKIEEVKLSYREQLVVVASAIYDFLPMKILTAYITLTSMFYYFVGSHFTNEHQQLLPFWGQMCMSMFLCAVGMIVVCLLGPILYEDLWKDGIKKRFVKSLRYRTLDMQEKVLKQTDEILLQQKRK